MDSEEVLEKANYRYFLDIATRWMDNDIYGHVNNVTYYSYFDTITNHFLIHEGGLDIQNGDIVGFVVASSCQYRSPISFPGTIQSALRVDKLGNSSVQYGVAIFREGEIRPAAHGTFTHVFVDRGTHKSVPIPVDMKLALQGLVSPPLQLT
jgi:acyl-CoA thioester hydrolase